MSEIEPQQLLIAKLAQTAPEGRMGRTALMKWVYFLQVLRQVPLPYRFTLYSYGPFDKDVLCDLGVAENLGLVREEVEYYPHGYGYLIQSKLDVPALAELDPTGFLQTHEGQIAWVLGEFGRYSAAQLELAATIVYADRDSHADSRRETADALSHTVHEIKPHFDLGAISQEIEDLRGKGLLLATGPAA